MRAAALLAISIFLIAATAKADGGDIVLKTCAAAFRAAAASRSGPAKDDPLARAAMLEKAAAGLASPPLSDLPDPPRHDAPMGVEDCNRRFFAKVPQTGNAPP